ncbi:MAG: 16S rRNA (cytosine(967)-C(5))-methyltransferase RsmB [Desulfobacteraceae bacterium]
MDSRDLALLLLNQAEEGPDRKLNSLHAALNRHVELSERDRAFVVHLVQGVYRWRIRLDWVIRQVLRFPFRQMEVPVLNLIRLALYQIFFMDRVPESAAVNEAVKQAKRTGPRHVAGVVNGVLRNVCRNKHGIALPEREQDPEQYLSVKYSYPLWLVNQWNREMGARETERLLEAGNAIPSLTVRTHTLKCSRQELLPCLRAEGVEGRPARFSPEGIAIDHLTGPIHRLRAFQQGWFQVQGEAAQVCSHLLAPRPGEAVLDVCAGLGGKSTHLACLMKDQGPVVAVDSQPRRLVRLFKNTARLGVKSVLPVAADAAAPLPLGLHASFDRILIDAPCSGLGVISKHPDIKVFRTENDIRRLSDLQGTMVDCAVPLLKPGGKMLYVTCTLSRAENEEVVEACLARHPRLTLENGAEHIPEWGRRLIDAQGYLRTLPHRHHMEGFFAALFARC